MVNQTNIEWAKFLRQHQWDLFVTLTKRDGMYRDASRSYANSMYEFFETKFSNVKVFWVAEKNRYSRTYHLHLLLHCGGGYSTREKSRMVFCAWQALVGSWEAKNHSTKILKFMEGEGCEEYVTKLICSKHCDYDFVFK